MEESRKRTRHPRGRRVAQSSRPGHTPAAPRLATRRAPYAGLIRIRFQGTVSISILWRYPWRLSLRKVTRTGGVGQITARVIGRCGVLGSLDPAG
jgi:hypothetical protein